MASKINHAIHQTGTAYRSNNAGDGPEKTRDHKYWFPRFKSNWLGTYRSKRMFICCECAVDVASMKRYKPVEGLHCVCGRDEWKKAKAVEEEEYNSRSELSKMYGGIRYEEAAERSRRSSSLKRPAPQVLLDETIYNKKPKLVEAPLTISVRDPICCNDETLVASPTSPLMRSPSSVAAITSMLYGDASDFYQLDPDMLPEKEIYDILDSLTDEESTVSDVGNEKKEVEFCNSFLDIEV